MKRGTHSRADIYTGGVLCPKMALAWSDASACPQSTCLPVTVLLSKLNTSRAGLGFIITEI